MSLSLTGCARFEDHPLTSVNIVALPGAIIGIGVAALGLLPLAYDIGAESDMLKPLAIAAIGALMLSVLLSLIATPRVYFVMRTFKK
ncbi:MAG: efflux RND transporter permease subunit [Methylobacter sp.]|uniref:efflux RND transporter permease subunit n=1 Tax=Methylobacter sp. TaxID=2051955 RepID=UPI002730A92F|nr:efflux RND transporter permease subunit [Methylobacter sp.]MDP1667142.1 efflux RND transporter permease subunit [Methylobacter sp.]MDP1970703.1 efflux RND transporter permease subunit [Methylobacter sp.]